MGGGFRISNFEFSNPLDSRTPFKLAHMTEKPARKTLYLIDGPNMAFRAFYAIGGMSNSQGLPTNALFGFTNMLLKLIRDHKPDHLAITWDPKGGSFREREFADYKGTRPDMPDALRAQMPHFKRVAEAFDIPYLCIDDFEADDVMGTLAKRHEDELDVVLISSDKDLMQLVTDHVSMYDSMKDRTISFAEVEEKFGCPPELVPDALGIWGDSSDNIPGVKGIGEKGVKNLLAVYRGLDEIYDHIEEITPPGVKKKLQADRDSAYLSRDLATIRTDAPVDVSIEDLALNFPPPEDRARELFGELEFRGLLRSFGGEMAGVDRSGYRLVTDDARNRGAARKALQGPALCSRHGDNVPRLHDRRSGRPVVLLRRPRGVVRPRRPRRPRTSNGVGAGERGARSHPHRSDPSARPDRTSSTTSRSCSGTA